MACFKFANKIVPVVSLHKGSRKKKKDTTLYLKKDVLVHLPTLIGRDELISSQWVKFGKPILKIIRRR